MGLHEILAQIDREINQLRQARAILAGNRASTLSPTPKKRTLTPEGRRRIAEAVKRRWAREKKKIVDGERWVMDNGRAANLA